jgi:hypothetical protein
VGEGLGAVMRDDDGKDSGRPRGLNWSYSWVKDKLAAVRNARDTITEILVVRIL